MLAFLAECVIIFYNLWGYGSVGRAVRSQRTGHEFESRYLHHQSPRYKPCVCSGGFGVESELLETVNYHEGAREAYSVKMGKSKKSLAPTPLPFTGKNLVISTASKQGFVVCRCYCNGLTYQPASPFPENLLASKTFSGTLKIFVAGALV